MSQVTTEGVGRNLDSTAHYDAVVQRALHAARDHVGLDVAFVSQFVDGERVFRYVDAAAGSAVVAVGGSDPLEDSYCHYVAGGGLPELLVDARRHPVSARLAATDALGVGTHLSVPIELPDGRVYGTFCCFGLEVNPLVNDRDVEVLRMLAQLVSEHLAEVDAREQALRDRKDRVAGMLEDPMALTMVFQPLVELATGRVFGAEALARFSSGERPDLVFAEAWQVGLGVELELKAVRTALKALTDLPAEVRLAINVAPATVVTTAFIDLVELVSPGRLTVEVTEHAAVADYDALRVARQRLSARGFRLAIDDVGMGFSGLNHILESAPDTIKIDAAVIRHVDSNPAKSAMVEALVAFGERQHILIIAEGIETEAEYVALKTIGVTAGQGYHLGRPGKLSDLLGDRALTEVRDRLVAPKAG